MTDELKPLTSEELNALDELAKAATQENLGRATNRGGYGFGKGIWIVPTKEPFGYAAIGLVFKENDAAHIAAMDPPTSRRLIHQARRALELEGENERLKKAMAIGATRNVAALLGAKTVEDRLDVEITKLKDKIARLQILLDAERANARYWAGQALQGQEELAAKDRQIDIQRKFHVVECDAKDTKIEALKARIDVIKGYNQSKEWVLAGLAEIVGYEGHEPDELAEIVEGLKEASSLYERALVKIHNGELLAEDKRELALIAGVAVLEGLKIFRKTPSTATPKKAPYLAVLDPTRDADRQFRCACKNDGECAGQNEGCIPLFTKEG